MTAIINASRDPDCLMCLTAHADGSWWSPLRPDSAPWISTPRNFLSEPMRWYELSDVAGSIDSGDDFTVCFRTKWFSHPGGATWLPFGNSPYDFRINSQGSIYWYCSAGRTAGQAQISMMVPGFSVNTAGIYEIRASVTGDIAALYVAELDDSGHVLRSASSQATVVERQAPTGAAYMVSQFPGTILEAWITRNGRRIWSYPSHAEYLRLFTRSAMRTDRGVFEAANPAAPWTLKTAVPAGNAGTVLTKLNGAVVTNPAQWNRSTATFHGAAGDRLEWLYVSGKALTAGQIAGFQ